MKLVRRLERCGEDQAIEIIATNALPGGAVLDHLNVALSPHARAKMRLLPPRHWPPPGVEILTEPCAPHAEAWAYLFARGLTIEDVRAHGIGYGRTERYRRYVVFPVIMDRAVVYYQGRAIWDPPAGLSSADRRAWVERTSYRKTLNPLSVSPYAEAEEVLLGYDEAKAYESVVIVEGPIDRVKVGPHAVALLGKEAGPLKIERLRRMPARRYVLYLDPSVYAKQPAKIEALALSLASHGEVYLASAPAGWDPGALTREQNRWCLERAAPWGEGALRLYL